LKEKPKENISAAAEGSQDLTGLFKKIRTFNAERKWQKFHSPKNLVMALSVEAAELLEHFQWLTEEESRSLSAAKQRQVAEEIADIFIYLLNLAGQLDIDPIAAAHAKIELNRRKYPVEKVLGKVGFEK
jgi:dCTP diphosphatase